MIRIEPTEGQTTPSFSGLQAEDDEWHLDPEQYRDFTEAVAGIALTADLSATDCYRIGNRLEAFIAERKRDGEWTEALLAEYSGVGSLAEIVALAQFLRTCHERCLDSGKSCT